MSDRPAGWNINDLADLILGASQPAADQHTQSDQQTKTPAHLEQPCGESVQQDYEAVLLLVNPTQDASEVVRQYADYWANRGESVAVFWIGESGIKTGLFDCSRDREWAKQIAAELQDGRTEALSELLGRSVQRVVCAIISNDGWQSSLLAQAARAACVLVEPSQYQLIRGYELLKDLAVARDECKLGCFVCNAASAEQASQVGERLQSMGAQFLQQVVKMEGFSLEQEWSAPSNLIAEAFLARTDGGESARLHGILLNCLDPSFPVDASPDAPLENEPAAVVSTMPTTEKRSALPTVRLLPTDRAVGDAVCDAVDFDRAIEGMLHELVDDAEDSWRIYASIDRGCCLRWVRRPDGARSIIVSTIECPHGALERALAWLHPVRGDDEIIVLAATITTDHRKAARAFSPSTRLFEVARTPCGYESALILKEVTSAVA